MTTYSSVPLTVLNLAQTFFIDPGVVQNAPEVSLTAIDLYFQAKPTATGNKSGMTKPGVTLYVSGVATDGYDEVPDTTQVVYNSTVYATWDSILVSNAASVATTFTFKSPINVDTGKSYAILVKYDGDETFVLWESIEGDKLVGTNTTTAGPAGKYVGKYFDFSYASGSNSAPNSTLNTSQSVDLTNSWKPLNTTDLKFSVYCAKYIPDGWANTTSVDPITGNTVVDVVAERSFLMFKDPYEFITYNRFNSVNTANIVGGELIWQNNVVQPTTVSVLSGSSLVTSQNANFASIFGSANNDKYIVVFSGNQKNIRKISSINSNTSLTVEIPIAFTNAGASFSKVAAGTVDLVSKTVAFGKSESALVIANSSANSTLRFSNGVIEALTISAGGTGYSNSDYIVVYNGGINSAAAVEANAVANLTTNSTGGIASYSLTNKGIGFLTVPTIAIKVANGSTNSSGSGATLTAAVGSTLLTELSNAVVSNTKVLAVPVNSVTVGAVDIENPYGTSYKVKNHYQYYSNPDAVNGVKVVSGGTGYANGEVVTFVGSGTGAMARANTDSTGVIVSVAVTAGGSGYLTSGTTASVTTVAGTGASLQPTVGLSKYQINVGGAVSNIDIFDSVDISKANTPLILSRSMEVMQNDSTIVTDTGISVNTNVSSVIEFIINSNNVYTTVDLLSGEVDVFFQKFSVNNDYTNENTGNGLAVAKHISKTINFGDNTLAEDIRVYADIYRPPNTDVKVYARIYNSKDGDAFVDKDWTLLVVKAGGTQYSTPKNLQDIVEITYGFPSYPNTAYTANGTATTALNSSNVAGANSNYTGELVVSDLVKIYSPLFPQNYQVAVVNSIVNSTLITLKSAVTNNGVVGSGLLVDRLAYKQQAFNDVLNSNVVTYYDSLQGVQQGYNSFAMKLVFLSDSGLDVPRVDDIRAIGVTA